MTDHTFSVIDGGRVVATGYQEGVDLAKRAEVGGRPVAVDASERARRLAALEAPDFTLPDLDGRFHSLSEHRGKKVFLVAFASW